MSILGDLAFEDNDIRSIELKGRCLVELKRYHEAEALIDPIISGDAPSAAVLNLKGELLFQRHAKQAARTCFERAIRIDPSYGRAYINLGLMQLDQEQENEAVETLEKGFILSPNVNCVVDTYHDLICEINAYERAETVFRDARRQYPANKRLAYLLIDILIQQNKLKEALDEIQTAMAGFGLEDGILKPALRIKKSLESSDKDIHQASITLCMIVKNEERHLAKSLASVKNAVREIVVVDTGSEDRTKDIAEIFGADIYTCEWNRDFSSARNLSVSKATSDWIFILDADEVVASRDLEALKAAAHRRTEAPPCAYSFVTRNYTNDAGVEGWQDHDGIYREEEAGIGWYPSAKVRLFPNQPAIRFENPVHELVEPSIRRAGIPIIKCSIPIHHYGTLDRKTEINKKADYYRLGKEKLALNQADPAGLVEHAIQTQEMGEYKKALTLWNRVLERCPDLPKAYFNLSYVHIQLENYNLGLEAARRAEELDPNLKEAVLNCALCQMRLGDVEHAIGHINRFLVDNPLHPMGIGLLATALCIRGDTCNGLRHFDDLRTMGFNCEEYVLDHASRLAAAGQAQSAIALLESVNESSHDSKDIRALLVHLTRVEINHPRLKIRLYDLKNDFPDLRPYLGSLTDFGLTDREFFASSENDDASDFIFFPYSLDPLFHHLGRDGLIRFVNNLSGFRQNEHKFIFFLLDDISTPLGLKSVLYRVNHDKRKTDFNSITLPYFVEDLFATPVHHELPYHVNFVGTPVTHVIRAYMLLPFLEKKDLTLFSFLLKKLDFLLAQRKNEAAYQTAVQETQRFVQMIFPINPIIRGIRYFIDISVDQFPKLPEHIQKNKRAELIDLINQSVATLCPRGFGVQSIRFFETLSAGRIPILLSDNYILPLENAIDYSAFIWKVGEGETMRLPHQLSELFESHSPDQLVEKANKARQTWQNFFARCRCSRFIRQTLVEVLEKDYRLNRR